MRCIKVLIIGSYNSFTTALVDYFNREGLDVYTLSGQSAQGRKLGVSRGRFYDFNIDDEHIVHIITSIAPDAIVYMGAHSDYYTFDKMDADSNNFLSHLTKILVIAGKSRLQKFVYLSSDRVFDPKKSGGQVLDESAPPTAADAKGIILQSAELLCRQFAESAGMSLCILRLSSVYGIPASAKDTPDFAVSAAARLLLDGQIPLPEDSPVSTCLFSSDAASGVYRALMQETPYALYHLAGKPLVYKDFISQMPEKQKGTENAYVTDAAGVYPNFISLSYGLIGEQTGYAPLITPERGLERVLRWTKDNIALFRPKETPVAAASGVKRSLLRHIWKRIRPYLENFVSFAVIVMLSFNTFQIPLIDNIDFPLFYVVMISITHGKSQSLIAIFLSFLIYFAKESENYLQMVDVSYFDIVLRLLSLFSIGMIIAHTRDRLELLVRDKEDEIDFVEGKLDDMCEINETNAKIKKILEDRLANHGDSMAKIHSIVSDLDRLAPETVMFSAVRVVSSVMHSDDCAIYSFSDNKDIARLVASTRQNDLKKSLFLRDMPLVAAAAKEGAVFVNEKLDSALPIMATPVYTGGEMVALVVLWGMPFESLTQYHINLFTVLCKLITSSIDRAIRYMQADRANRYMEGTGILKADAFLEILHAHEAAKREGTADYCLMLAQNGSDILPLSELLSGLLRTNDALGLDKEGRLLVLLANTSAEDLPFVENRLKAKGITLSPAGQDSAAGGAL